MTTLAELGRMLIEVGENGRTLQRIHKSSGSTSFGETYPTDTNLSFNLEFNEYRLKPEPKVTYYRVYRRIGGPFETIESDAPFPPFNEVLKSMYKHIHDFSITEEP